MKNINMVLEKYIDEEDIIDNDDDDFEPLTNDDIEDMKAFESFYGDLDESRKSHIVKILLGHGVLKKGENGKIVKGDNYRKYRSTLKKAGVNHKKVHNPHKRVKKS